ncbi:hypothetical protein CSA37_12150 [Candidatus Fermentibacteria bacterium]|nr:MAG: hypothetical protein CSA37_12150 [Candidatus Fermentibacteria bacterium]
MKNQLKVPLAFNSDRVIVKPADASKDETYYCPGCGDVLVLRKGTKKIPHFAHKASDSCSNETIIHSLAKKSIAEVVDQFIRNKSASPIVKRRCSVCGDLHEQKLPQTVSAVSVERKLNTGFIADVALSSNDEVLAVIEVLVTHEVSKNKAKLIGIPFIEVSGEEILKDPMNWYPLKDYFKPFSCTRCESAKREFWHKLQEVSNSTGITLPREYYRTTTYRCWKCKKEILVFDWPGNRDRNATPNEPRPKSIQYRYSSTVKHKYWANTCPYCRQIQGNFFMFSEPDSNFFGFQSGEDTVEDYQHDMLVLAVRHDTF